MYQHRCLKHIMLDTHAQNYLNEVQTLTVIEVRIVVTLVGGPWEETGWKSPVLEVFCISAWEVVTQCICKLKIS